MSDMSTDQGSDYDKMTPEEWDRAIETHIKNLDRVVTQAIAKAVDEYVIRVFMGARGTELTFVGEVIKRYEEHIASNDLLVELRPRRS